jgi:hypothetical protein
MLKGCLSGAEAASNSRRSGALADKESEMAQIARMECIGDLSLC